MPSSGIVLELRGRSSERLSSSASYLSQYAKLSHACGLRHYTLFCPETTDGDASSMSCNLERLKHVVARIRTRLDELESIALSDAPTISPNPTPAAISGKPFVKSKVSATRKWLECVSEKGRWKYDSTPRILPWEFSGFMNLCDYRHSETGLVTKKADAVVKRGGGAKEWTVRETLKYVWETPPGACPNDGLAPFDPDTFCSQVGRGLNILFLGDSLTEQFVTSFLNNVVRKEPKPAMDLIHQFVPEQCKDWMPNSKHKFCLVYVLNSGVCSGLTVQFLRNDHLYMDDEEDIKFDHMPWTKYKGLYEADVFILNRGAHFKGDKDYSTSVTEALSFLRKNFPERLTVFRNTPPGHANCTSYSLPIESRQDPSILPFNWDKFQHQNELAKEITESLGAIYMDVDTMTALRPDGHKGYIQERGLTDCLHYCTPGPIDLWVQLFAGILLELLPHLNVE